MIDDLDDTGEIRAVSASVLYDGQIAVMLSVPGHDELVETTFPGDEHTLLMTWEPSKAMDLDGTTAADRRCQMLVARGVARLNHELVQRRRRLERRQQEQQQREDGYGA